jgi:hypothetical protein
MDSNGESRVVLRCDTKQFLRPGVVLRFADGSAYRVQSVFCGSDRCRSASSVSVTVVCPDGRVLYCAPSSDFYGAEIVF